MSQAKLTDHQKRSLAALVLLDGTGKCPASRRDIGSIVYDTCQGVQLKTMLALEEAELVEAESRAAVRLVQYGICICGCDLWCPTKIGIELVATMKVRFGEHGRWHLAATPATGET